MENYLYRCQYCSKDYKPNRRKKQKYCSNSCRTRAFVTKKSIGLNIVKKEVEKKEPHKVEKMSLAGVGNAAVGSLAVNVLTNLLTSEENKPATKKDLQNLINKLNIRYQPITNLPRRNDGTNAYFDMEGQILIYF
jgi:sensor c-di-GMP phosphodiesterase-like protein